MCTYIHVCNTHCTQGVISQPVLEQVLASKLPAKSQANMRALVNCALEMPPPKPGKVDYFKLMSPVSSCQYCDFGIGRSITPSVATASPIT